MSQYHNLPRQEVRRFFAVYFLWSDGMLAYVGMSGFLLHRIGQHAKHAPFAFDSFSCVECQTVEEAARLEKQLIRELHPIHNIEYTGKKSKMVFRQHQQQLVRRLQAAPRT